MVIRMGSFRSYEERLDEIQAQAAWWVAREHTGGIREAERMELREWLARSPAHELEYMLVDSLYADDDLVVALRMAPRYVPAQRGSQIRSILSVLRGAVTSMFTAAPLPQFAAALASILLVFCVAAALLPWDLSGPSTEDPRLAEGMELKAADGEHLLVQLPDGTRVEMAGGSEAQVRFTAKARHFALKSGDALFEVAHNPARPFLIASHRAAIRVIGTRFLVRETDADTRVDVFDGVVEIHAPAADASTMRVRRGSRVTIGRDVTIEGFDPNAEDDWRAGWVDEPEISLHDLAHLVERRSGIPIVVDPALAQLQISGRFRITRPQQLFTKLGSVYHFGLRLEGDTYYIDKNY